MRSINDYLHSKPQIGIICGMGSGLIARLQYLVTDEGVLKIVSGISIWLGGMVALLSFIVWVKKAINQYRSPKPN